MGQTEFTEEVIQDTLRFILLRLEREMLFGNDPRGRSYLNYLHFSVGVTVQNAFKLRTRNMVIERAREILEPALKRGAGIEECVNMALGVRLDIDDLEDAYRWAAARTRAAEQAEKKANEKAKTA